MTGETTRRAALGAGLAWAAAGRLTPVAARTVPPTPPQTEGPYYPSVIPLDADNDLLRIAGRGARADGTPTHVAGRVLDPSGRPVAGALVEIWQCDAHGRYHHVDGEYGRAPRDANFQGFGRAVTNAGGVYRFRTIRPAPYPGRTPHIHFAIMGRGFEPLVTQMYVAGEPGNATDGVLNAIRDPAERARLIVPLRPAPDLEPGALTGAFDVVLGG